MTLGRGATPPLQVNSRPHRVHLSVDRGARSLAYDVTEEGKGGENAQEDKQGHHSGQACDLLNGGNADVVDHDADEPTDEATDSTATARSELRAES